MNFLIAVPRFVRFGFYYDFPLGLAYIAQALKDAGHNIICLNLNNYNNTVERLFLEHIENNDIDVFCTGGLSSFFQTIHDMLAVAKAIKPTLKTIVGGGLITAEPELVMELLENADYGVIGEGEITVVELANALRDEKQWKPRLDPTTLFKIPGIIYKTNDKFQWHGATCYVQTAKRPQIKNIDILPYPDYDDMGIKHYLDMQLPNDVDSFNFFEDPRVMPIIASRGCPYNCTFCFSPLGKRYRQHSLDYIFKHIDFLIENYQVNGVFILDELFSTKASQSRLVEFCERIKERDIYWMAQLRGDSVNNRILKLMRESGCVLISYGIESGSNKILKSMRKHITIGEITKALEWTYQNKIGNKGNLIFGDRAETVATFRQSLRWWEKNRKYQIQLSRITVYPGSPSYYYAISQGIIKDKKDFLQKCKNTNLNLTKIDDDVLFKMLDWGVHVRRFAGMPGKMIECRKIGHDAIKCAVYDFTVQCPHCLEESHYTNMTHQAKEKYILYCRACRQKFRTLPFNVETAIDHVLRQYGDKRLAVWYTEPYVFFHLAIRLLENVQYIVQYQNPPPKEIAKKTIIQYEDKEQLEKLVDIVIYPVSNLVDIIYTVALIRNGVDVIIIYAFHNIEAAFDILNYLAYYRQWAQAVRVLEQMGNQMPNIFLSEGILRAFDNMGVGMG